MTAKRERVGEILNLQRRAMLIDPTSTYEEIGVRSFGRGIFHKEPVSGVDLGSKRVFRIQPGDLVISNVFAWEGAIAVATDAEEGKIGSHRFMTFIPSDGRIDTSWAAWYFRSEQGIELIRKASPGSAGRNRTLAIDRFEALEIPVPPIDEQRAWAERLDGVSLAVAELSQRSKRSSELAEAFVVSASTRSDLDEKAKTRAGWRRIVLSDILEPSVNNVQVEPSGRYRIAGIYSFGRGLINRKEIGGVETSYKSLTRLRDGDIVISKLGAWEGAVAVVDSKFDGYCVSSEYPTFKIIRERCLPEFFRGIARSPGFWEELGSSTRGSMARRKRITPAEFLRVQIWLPPIETQIQVAAWLDAVDRVASVRDQHKTLEEALIPAAMNQAFAELI